jgi:hypothetical protein
MRDDELAQKIWEKIYGKEGAKYIMESLADLERNIREHYERTNRKNQPQSRS